MSEIHAPQPVVGQVHPQTKKITHERVRSWQRKKTGFGILYGCAEPNAGIMAGKQPNQKKGGRCDAKEDDIGMCAHVRERAFRKPTCITVICVSKASVYCTWSRRLEITVVLIRQRSSSSALEFGVVLSHEGLVDLDLGGSKSGSSSELESVVADELSRQPEERLFEVVVGLGRDFKVLQVLLAVEGNRTGLDLALLDINLVTAKNNGDVLADALQITVPVGHVLVGNTRSHVEHDDTALTLDVVSITQTTKLLLSRSVPDVEADGAEVGVELKRVYLNTECGNVLLLELSGQVTLDEGGLAGTTVTDEDELELGNFQVRGRHLGRVCARMSVR